MNIPDGAKVGLIGLIFNPSNIETPWLVQDNRKVLKNEYPCATKADVLDKITEILDDMSHFPSKLERGNDDAEVVVAITLQASLCDLGDEVNTLDLRAAALQAVANAVQHHEQEGFTHALADKVAFGVREVRTLGVE
jgi:hypothetical protein